MLSLSWALEYVYLLCFENNLLFAIKSPPQKEITKLRNYETQRQDDFILMQTLHAAVAIQVNNESKRAIARLKNGLVLRDFVADYMKGIGLLSDRAKTNRSFI